MHLNRGKRGLRTALFALAMLVAPISAHAQGGFDFGDDASGGGDAGFDFGSDGGAAPAPAAPVQIDTSSEAYTRYKDAQNMIDAKQYLQAAQVLNDVIMQGSDAAFALAPQLHYELGRALYEAGYYQAALNHFDMVVQAGPSSQEFMLTLNYLVMIGRVLPGEPNRYTRIYDNYLNKFPTEIQPAMLSELGYLLGMAAYR